MLKKPVVAVRTLSETFYPLSLAFLLGLAVTATAIAARADEGANAGADDKYDRLDGTGLSRKTVNVIEWEGNLEIHVYPAGSLKGLSLKLDKRDKSKPVMVIGYRFSPDPKDVLIRRAILGIDLKESFKAYRDPSSADEYDKIIISNNGLPLQAYKLDPAPKQLYPDGHPAIKTAENEKKDGEVREPASRGGETNESGPAVEAEAKPDIDEDGRIRPFFSEPRMMRSR